MDTRGSGPGRGYGANLECWYASPTGRRGANSPQARMLHVQAVLRTCQPERPMLFGFLSRETETEETPQAYPSKTCLRGLTNIPRERVPCGPGWGAFPFHAPCYRLHLFHRVQRALPVNSFTADILIEARSPPNVIQEAVGEPTEAV